MFHLGMFLFSAVLFFVLTPGVLVSLPHKGKKYTVAAVHALIFAVVWHFTHKAAWYLTEGFAETTVPAKPAPPQVTAGAIAIAGAKPTAPPRATAPPRTTAPPLPKCSPEQITNFLKIFTDAELSPTENKYAYEQSMRKQKAKAKCS